MNQGIDVVEIRHDDHHDGLVYTSANLGPAIGMSDFTVFRVMSQEPDRLPPPVFMSKPGAKKQKRVWLKTTVAQWLQERQEEHGQPSPVRVQVQVAAVAVAVTSGRGRGRPRKITGAAL